MNEICEDNEEPSVHRNFHVLAELFYLTENSKRKAPTCGREVTLYWRVTKMIETFAVIWKRKKDQVNLWLSPKQQLRGKKHSVLSLHHRTKEGSPVPVSPGQAQLGSPLPRAELT